MPAAARCGAMRESPAVTQTKAVFLDALGTLVELEPPWVGLRKALGEGIPDERLVAAVRAEMSYYKAHSHEGRDPQSLAELRARCAEVLSRELGAEVDVDTLVEAIRFAPYPDAVPALRALRDAGMKLVCVSNWDVSLEQVLERCGLAEHLDGAVSSALAGARKPDPAIFAPALELAGASAEQALHVGDTAEEDLDAARAAGIRALLIDREGGGDVASLEEVQRFL
jgi:putative hydrolase of the HAD superfamily